MIYPASNDRVPVSLFAYRMSTENACNWQKRPYEKQATKSSNQSLLLSFQEKRTLTVQNILDLECPNLHPCNGRFFLWLSVQLCPSFDYYLVSYFMATFKKTFRAQGVFG